MKYVAEISDPIHHYIYLTEVEKKIIDTLAFQRLREIRQLSGTHLTYPSAHHTRFEHSLGVMHLAGLASDALYEKGYIKDEDKQKIRLAALLHDIGHGPFSHLFEEAMGKEHTAHEEIGSKIIKEKLSDILSNNGYTTDEIISLVKGESNKKFLNEIISGILSVDAMDYLQRDAYFTGVEHARIDAERIINSYDVHEDKLALDYSALYSLESLLISRYQMFKSVYFHRTVRAAQVMLLHAISSVNESLKEKIVNIDEYLKLTDNSVLNFLLCSNNERACNLTKDYLERRLLKCAFEYKIEAGDRRNYDEGKRKEIEKAIAEKANVNEEDIYIDVATAPSLSLTPSKDLSKKIILKKEERYEEKELKEFPLISAILGYINMIRVYTKVEHKECVKVASEKVLKEVISI